jgi:hypothetical protein
MKENNLSGLSPIWLIGLALVLGTTIVTLIPLTIAATTAASWIGLLGSVLSGCLTVIGFFFAANNVKRQLRINLINLISREEERIEDQMPGLVQLRDKLDPVSWADEPANVLRALQHFRHWMDLSGFDQLQQGKMRQNEIRRATWSITEASLAKAMPTVDAILVRKVLPIVVSLQIATAAKVHNPNEISVPHDAYQRELKRLEDFVREIDSKIALYERRLTCFRGELEKYFEQ